MIKKIISLLLIGCCALSLSAQTMVLFSPDPTPPPPPPATPFTATFTGLITYNGGSRIDARGIGYYQETIPATATIAVEIEANLATSTLFTLSASEGGLTYTYTGPIQAGKIFYALSPNSYTPSNYDDIGTVTLTLTHAVIQGTVTLRPRIDVKSLPADQTAVVPITVAGRTWMDRPLGAHRRATHVYNDTFAKASHFQWGRSADGHEVWVTSGDDSRLRGPLNNLIDQRQDIPSDARLIFNYNSESGSYTLPDGTIFSHWRENPTGTLWDGVSAVNNPCPNGYRLPTMSELTDFINEALPNGFDSHTANPPYVHAHGIRHSIFYLGSPISRATIPIPSSMLFTTKYSSSEVNSPNFYASVGFVEQSSTTFTTRTNIYPSFVVRCIQD